MGKLLFFFLFATENKRGLLLLDLQVCDNGNFCVILLYVALLFKELFFLFQGYILGNPVTIRNSNTNFQIPYAHRMALISDELFEVIRYFRNKKT